MRILVLAVLALCLVQDPDFTWRTDLDAAIAEAERGGKPLLLVFR